MRVLHIPAVYLALAAYSGTQCKAAGEGGLDQEATVNAANDRTDEAKNATVLFDRATQYHRDKKWHELADTLDELLAIQPKNAPLRKFAAWNVTHNLSGEAEDVEGQYSWFRRGLRILMEGIKLDRSTVDHWLNTGWDLAFVIGTRDRSAEIRKLFANDAQFHAQIGHYVAVDQALGCDGKPDNWLVGRLFFVRAIEMVQKEGVSPGESSPLFSFARPAMCRTNYASALNQEGRFDDIAVQAWREAEKEWQAFGELDIPTPHGFSIKLNDQDRQVAETVRFWADFDRLQSGLRDRLRSEAHAALPGTLRKALEKPLRERTLEEMTAADEAEKAIEITPEMLAKSVTGANRFEAMRIGRKAIAANERTKAIRTTRAIVGIDRQLLRCQWERSDVLIEARRLTYAADQQLAEARTKGNTVGTGVSRQLYDKAFQKWADVIAELGDVANESFVRYAVLDAVDRYRREILNTAPLPDDFPLREKVAEWKQPAR